jgi:hypothetical protein
MYGGVLSYRFPYKRFELQMVWIYYLDEGEVISSELLRERMPMIERDIQSASMFSDESVHSERISSLPHTKRARPCACCSKRTSDLSTKSRPKCLVCEFQ